MPSLESPMWQLAAIVEVPFEDRIQCQCKTCGHVIYKRVHIIVWADDRIECWGQDCYKRELGATEVGRTAKPVFEFVGGRRLTLEERELLRQNRELLIARFREEERRAQSEREQEKAFREAREKQKRLYTKPAHFPPGRDVTSEFARHQPAPISVGSQHGGWPPDREGTCKYCGKKTRDWQSFFGSTGMCVCRDCYRQGKLQ
jgi:hypothetical protein